MTDLLQVNGQVINIAHILLKLACKDYSFLDPAIKWFEHGLDFIYTLELDASCDDPNAIAFFQSFQVSYTWLVPFLMGLNCS